MDTSLITARVGVSASDESESWECVRCILSIDLGNVFYKDA